MQEIEKFVLNTKLLNLKSLIANISLFTNKLYIKKLQDVATFFRCNFATFYNFL